MSLVHQTGQARGPRTRQILNENRVVEFHQSLVCHRSDLHDELKRLAIGEGEGPPAQLHLDSKVVASDPDAGCITLSNGEIIDADVVIGADGIHVSI